MALFLKSAFRNPQSSNHLIRPLQHADWNRQIDLFRRLEIDQNIRRNRQSDLLGRLDASISPVIRSSLLVHLDLETIGTL
jgi:hypothetical protein